MVHLPGCHNGDAGNGGRPTIDRPHWSYSQISQFLRCPLQYYFERIVRLPKPFVSTGLALGSSVHHALAEYHRSIQRGTHLKPEQLRAILVQKWTETEGRDSVQYRDGEVRGSLIEQGIALVSLYAAEPIPESVVAVEEPLLVPLFDSHGEALEKPLLAVPDLIVRDRDGLKVTEFKTSGRRYGELETETSLQASCYAHAVHERYGEHPKVEYTILVKTKTPQIQHLETARNEGDICRLGDIVGAIDRAIEESIFYPIESSMNCSGCPFLRPCREWRGCSRRHRQDNKIGNGQELTRC
jgi:putative RecB family exonuclease